MSAGNRASGAAVSAQRASFVAIFSSRAGHAKTWPASWRRCAAADWPGPSATPTRHAGEALQVPVVRCLARSAAGQTHVWAALPPGWGRIWCCEQVRHAGLGLAHWSRAAAQAWWLGVCADFCRRQVHNGLELDRGTTSGWAQNAEGSVVAGQLLFSELELAALQFASAWLCTD